MTQAETEKDFQAYLDEFYRRKAKAQRASLPTSRPQPAVPVDPVTIAAAARAYRDEQRKAGVEISTTAAVEYIMRKHGLRWPE